MHRRLLLATAGLWGALSSTLVAAQSPSPAAPVAVDLAGVRYPATVSVGGSTLVLNGAGIRWRLVVRVYTAGLYLAGKASTPEAVLAATGPKRMHVVMLRDIDGNDLGKLFTRGMQDNSSREDFAKSIPGTLRMAELFAAKKRLAQGEHFSVDWLPGQGTTILINGKPQGEPIKEPEFFNALMRIWLGTSPADAALKDALLGQAPRPGGGTNHN
ncbi:MAG: chalcone isomerase family protein [Rubrivivax sp.]